jgi:hypothetical protein
VTWDGFTVVPQRYPQPGTHGLEMVSRLAKRLGADRKRRGCCEQRARHVILLRAEKRARWNSTHEPQGCLTRTASLCGLGGGVMLGEMCRRGVQFEAYLISAKSRMFEVVDSGSCTVQLSLGPSAQVPSRRHGNSSLVASGVSAARSLSTQIVA